MQEVKTLIKSDQENRKNVNFPLVKSFSIYENELDEFTIYDENSRSDFDDYHQLFDIECSFR